MKSYLGGLLVGVWLVAGCSKSDNHGAAATPVPAKTAVITGSVDDALVLSATVTAYEVSAAGVVGVCVPASTGGCTTATTDANGSYTLTITGYTGPVLLQATGGSYTDTVTGQTVAIPNTLQLSVFVPSVTPGTATVTAQLTGLTTIAANLALGSMAAPQSLSATAAATAADTLMQTWFGVQNITSGALLNLAAPNCGTASGITQANFDSSLVLAGIAQLASQYGVSSAELTAALIQDFSSNGGVPTGLLAGGTAITVGSASVPLATIEGSSLGASLLTAIQTFIQSTANACAATASTALQGALTVSSPAVTQRCTSAYYCYDLTIDYTGPSGVGLDLQVNLSCPADTTNGNSGHFVGATTVTGTGNLTAQPFAAALTASQAGGYAGSANYDYANSCGTNTLTVSLAKNQGVACTFTPATVSFQSGDGGYHNNATSTVAAVCAAATYTVGGTVAGLASGTSVTIQDLANSDSVVVNADGGFSLPAPLANGAAFNVQAVSSSAAQACVVQGGGSGTVSGANVSLTVVCGAASGGGGGSPAVYVVDATNTLFAFDAGGNKLGQVALPQPVSNLDGGGIATDANNVYVTVGATHNGALQLAPAAVVAFNKSTLAPVSLPSGSFGNLNTPRGIVYDAHNSQFYIGNGGSNVTIYSAAGTYLSDITSGVYGPSGVAFDSVDDTIWVANDTNGVGANATYGINEFNENGTVAQTIDAATQFQAPLQPAHVLPYAVAYCAPAGSTPALLVVGFLQDNTSQDPNGTLGVSEGGIYAISGASPAPGTLVAAFSAQLAPTAQPNAMSCSSTGTIYVAANDGLHLYSTSGASTALPSGGFAGLSAPIYGVLAAD